MTPPLPSQEVLGPVGLTYELRENEIVLKRKPEQRAARATPSFSPPRKLCDTTLIRSLGWSSEILLSDGLRRTVAEYRAEAASGILRG